MKGLGKAKCRKPYQGIHRLTLIKLGNPGFAAQCEIQIVGETVVQCNMLVRFLTYSRTVSELMVGGCRSNMKTYLAECGGGWYDGRPFGY